MTLPQVDTPQEPLANPAKTPTKEVRLARLREQVANGSYRPDWTQVAELFLLREFGFMECPRALRQGV